MDDLKLDTQDLVNLLEEQGYKINDLELEIGWANLKIYHYGKEFFITLNTVDTSFNIYDKTQSAHIGGNYNRNFIQDIVNMANIFSKNTKGGKQ